MALKDRLDARRRPETVETTPSTGGLSIIAGALIEPPAAPAPAAAEETVQKTGRVPATLSAAKTAIHTLLVERHADEIDITDRAGVRASIARLTDEHIKASGLVINRLDYGHLVDALLDEVLGLGPLQPLLEDSGISEIMVNKPSQIYVERHGRVSLSPMIFESDAQLRQVIDRIVSTVGRRVDESSPMCDARLRDGSREKLRPEDLLATGTATADVLKYLRAAVRSRLSILVSGGTSSGKTTLLNILSGYIPTDERIVTVEDSAELQLRQEHVIRLESRPPNVEGTGAIAIRDLVRNALRMRPDRIIVGECRGGEALDMLQAMNTGHEGSMSTVHANSPYDAFGRLETMVLMAGADLPARAIQKQIASAIDLVVQVERVRGGQRKIVSVVEITGLTNGEMQYQELFQFKQSGVDPEGNAIGVHTSTGHRSIHMDHFDERGEALQTSIFEPAVALV